MVRKSVTTTTTADPSLLLMKLKTTTTTTTTNTTTGSAVAIHINDIFGEVVAENKRLTDELAYVCQLIGQLKTHLSLLHDTYWTFIDSRHRDEWQSLKQKLTVIKTTITTTTTATADNNNTKKEKKKTEETNVAKKPRKRRPNGSLCGSLSRLSGNAINNNKHQEVMSITTTTTITNNKPTDVLSLSTDVVDNDDNRQTVSKQHKPIKRQKRWVRPKYKEMSDDDDDDYVNNDNNNYYSDSNSYTDNADTTATTVTTTENPMDPKQCKYFDKDLNKYVCPQCDRRLDREKQIYRHLHIVHKVERPCICFYPDCDKTYANRQYLDRHLEAHVRPQIRLPEPESDPNSLLLMKRNNFDETSGQYMCPNPDCELGFPSSRQLYAHFYSQHYIRGEWRCDYPDCSKVYKTKVLLDVHQKIHSDVKPYVCQHPECTNAYRTKAEWKSHQKVHQENRQTYQCPDCEMVCLSEKYLNKHMIYKHSGEKTIKCGIDDCEEMFHFPYQRTRHRKKVHNVKYAPDKRIVRECQWPGCEYRTDHCTKLKTHMRKHTGERVACQWPGCEFTTTSDTLVKEHMRRHTGERPYECQWPDCGKRFRTYKIYRTHYDIHRNHKPFVCDWPGCDYRSNSKGNLYTHKRTHEKDKYPTKPRIRPSRAKTANKSQLLSSAKKLSPKKLVKSHVIVTGTDSTGADSGGGGGGGIIGGDLPQEGSTTTTTAATIAHLSQLFQNAH